MAKQIFDVFEQEGTRLVVTQDPHNVEEQRTLCLICKTVRPAEGILLAYTSQRERLAGKPGQQQVVRRDNRGVDLRDVSS